MNERHGHVIPRADGFKARCGGLALGCVVCAEEKLGVDVHNGVLLAASLIRYAPIFKWCYPKPFMRELRTGWWCCHLPGTHDGIALDAHKAYDMWKKRNHAA